MSAYNIPPKQKRLKVQKKEVKKDKDGKALEHFIYQNMDAIEQALYCLRSPATFKLYMYLAKQNPKPWWNLSSKDFEDKTGCKVDAYNTAVKELLHFGYLTKIANSERDEDYLFTDYVNADMGQIEAKIEAWKKVKK